MWRKSSREHFTQQIERFAYRLEQMVQNASAAWKNIPIHCFSAMTNGLAPMQHD